MPPSHAPWPLPCRCLLAPASCPPLHAQPRCLLCKNKLTLWLLPALALLWVVQKSAAATAEEAAEDAEAEAEAAGGKPAARRPKKRSADADLASDEAAMKDIMMTRKAKKMYQGLQKKKAEKAARVATLEQKAAALKKN